MLPTVRIDAHQHYWHYDPVEYAWLDDSMRALQRDFMPEDALREMRGAGFRYASHLAGRFNNPRNAQPPMRTGSLSSSRKPRSRANTLGSATSAIIAR